MRSHFSGSGPGPQSRDGCSVELYREMPYCGDLDEVMAFMPAGARVLELGCGAGRLTRHLLGHGFAVTAIDNCPGMLAGLPAGAQPVLSDIETLALDARFDVVLLASNLVNHPDLPVRAAFLAAAHRHLAPGGRAFVQRHDAHWLRSAPAGFRAQLGELTVVVDTVSREGDLVSMAIRYEHRARTWHQSFVVEVLDEPAVEDALREAGFDALAWIGLRRRWIAAGMASG